MNRVQKNNIKDFITTVNGHFDKSAKRIDDFLEESLQWCDEMIALSGTERSKGRNTRKRRGYAQTSSIAVGEPSQKRPTRANDSVAANTRLALRMLRETESTIGNIGNSQNESGRTSRRRGLRSVRGGMNERTGEGLVGSTTHKTRSDEGEETPKGEKAAKRFKQSKSSVIESSKDETEIFKKPKTRGKKAKKESVKMKNLKNETVEESQFFNAVLAHSSPKENPGSTSGNASRLLRSSVRAQESPKPSTAAISGSTMLANLTVGHLTPTSTSNDFIKDSNGEETVSSTKIFTTEDNKVNATQKARTRGTWRETKQKSSKTNSPAVSSNSKNSSKSNVSKVVELPIQSSSDREVETTDSPKSTVPVAVETQKTEKSRTVTPVSGDDDRNQVVRLTRSQKRSSQDGSSSAKSEKNAQSVEKEEPLTVTALPKPELNATQEVSRGVKRTKPVLNSKIFDNKGNIMSSLSKTVVKGGSSEKPPPSPASLGVVSSKAVEDVKIKEEVRTPPPTYGFFRTPPAFDRRSNEENQPQRRSKKTKKSANTEVADTEADTGRITRTKSKLAEARKAELNKMARKSVNKAKIMSIQLDKLKILKVLKTASKCNTRKDEYEPKEKLCPLTVPSKRCGMPELQTKSAMKHPREDRAEKEILLKALREKTEKAASKKDMAIKNRQKELKYKNEMKLMSAAKQRQKLEKEKYNNILQSEKEKEERHNLLLQERKEGLKEKQLRKQMMTQKKLADTEERRRLGEEERMAKLKEQAAEQEKKMLERQKELERQEKRLQEHQDEMKKREMFEKKQKENQMMEKAAEAKKPGAGPTACNLPKPNLKRMKLWNYRPRNENDYGLEDELSEDDSETEEVTTVPGRIPLWAKNVLGKKCPVIQTITQEMMMEYISCHQKTPDIHKMFKMTPKKRIKRTSSAIWNTPSS